MSRPSRTYDNLLLMKDAGALSTDDIAQVDGADAVIDVGEARFYGVLVVNTSALDETTTDETYELTIQGSDDSAFGSGVVDLAVGNVPQTGRQEIFFSNQLGDDIYRYLRLSVDVGGTTPSIEFTAHIAKM